MGPVTKIPHAKDMIPYASEHLYTVVSAAVDKFGIYAMGSDSSSFWKKELLYQFCHETGDLCKKVMGFFMNAKTKYDDTERYYAMWLTPT